jgi:ATP/maltotriose-dependent transcriptional regulator MalT
MRAIRGLDQAGSPAAPRLLKRMEQCVEELPCQSDSERAHLCQACTHLAYAYRDLGLGEFSSRWRDLASRMAQDTQDPDWRTDAAVALAHSESVQGNSQAAGAWLAEAVSAWTGIEEWSFARWRIRDIFEAWALIPERGTREEHLGRIRGLLWSVPDLELRDTLQARLAVASWDNPPLSRELMEGIQSQGGLETALTALHEAKTLPDWVLPGALEDVLEKCTKQALPFFAGQALLAAQTAARFGIYTRETVATVLAGIEDRMREFAPLPGGGPVSSPAEIRVTHYMDSLR